MVSGLFDPNATPRVHYAIQNQDAATRLAVTSTADGVLCPHSAVAAKVAKAHLGAIPMITLATAHPAKFPAAVEAASGIRPELPPHMADLFDRPERVTRVANDLGAIKSLIRERVAS